MSNDSDSGDAHERALSVSDRASRQGNPRDDLSRRTSHRVETHDNGTVIVQNVGYTVEICDVSEDGAQIRMRQGLMPSVGRGVTLQFVDGTSVESRVVWERGTLVGLQFNEPLSDALDVAYFDDLGSEYFRALLKRQISRG